MYIYRLTIVESIPENLTFPAGSPSHPSTFDAWRNLLDIANKTIDIVALYWTLRGKDLYEDPSDWQVREIYGTTNMFLFSCDVL